MIALDVKTGKLRWHYQFTPHDLHDWDATEPLVLVDTDYGGRPRKLLLQANRNGFIYVLDRTTGEFLFAKPFVKKMNWASGYSADGKPQLLPGQYAHAGRGQGLSLGARRYQLVCDLLQSGHEALLCDGGGGLQHLPADPTTEVTKGIANPADPGLKYLRAIDIRTGKTVWEIPQQGPQEANYSGVLSTAGGLVFYGETGGGFAAVDAKTGKTLWTFHGKPGLEGLPDDLHVEWTPVYSGRVRQ